MYTYVQAYSYPCLYTKIHLYLYLHSFITIHINVSVLCLYIYMYIDILFTALEAASLKPLYNHL